MKNPYRSYTVSELVAMIEHLALDLMGEPITGGLKQDDTLMTMQEVDRQNSLLAMNDAGIRLMARELISLIEGDGDDDDG